MLSFKNTTLIAIALLSMLAVPTLHAQDAEMTSDLLIVLDSDGRSYTVQHTIATNGPLMRLRLPGSIVPLEVLFLGPDHIEQREQYNTNPNLLELNSGSAFARYQHQYGVEVQQVQSDHFVLTTPSVPENIELNDSSLSHSSTTWVFPNEYELISYTVTDPTTGHWVVVNNTLTFHQLSKDTVELSINYKKSVSALARNVSACDNGSVATDACSGDKDKDGIPDYRDICVSKLGLDNNRFGCEKNKGMLLDAVDFKTGRTYLDVSARQQLDRVAHALLRNEGQYIEIGAHTDNEGAAEKNMQLSKKRADAVRHYLLLKGVNPNMLRAAGYGEKYPIRDNASSDGRRANRRVELIVIN